jgi:hypothetical protein
MVIGQKEYNKDLTTNDQSLEQTAGFNTKFVKSLLAVCYIRRKEEIPNNMPGDYIQKQIKARGSI